MSGPSVTQMSVMFVLRIIIEGVIGVRVMRGMMSCEDTVSSIVDGERECWDDRMRRRDEKKGQSLFLSFRQTPMDYALRRRSRQADVIARSAREVG